MRSKVLIMSTAALLAGTLAAASQSIQPGGGTQDKGKQESSSPGTKSSPGAREQTKGQAERGQEVQKGKTQGQVQRDQDNLKGKTQGQAERAQDNAKDKQKSPTQGQAREQDNLKGKTQTEGQAQRDQDNLKGKTQTEGQTQHDQDRIRAGEREGRSGNNTVSFTTEQRTKIRETVFRERNAPRVGKVDFSLNVGTAVPRTVHIVEVPEVIVDVHPEWRGYRYFIVNDEIVIVQPDTLKIVAIVDV